MEERAAHFKQLSQERNLQPQPLQVNKRFRKMIGLSLELDENTKFIIMNFQNSSVIERRVGKVRVLYHPGGMTRGKDQLFFPLYAYTSNKGILNLSKKNEFILTKDPCPSKEMLLVDLLLETISEKLTLICLSK